MSKNKLRLADGYRYFGKRVRNGWVHNGGKICTIAGTTGLFLSGVHACRKTYKIHDELAENGRRISEAKQKRDGDRKGARTWRGLKESVKCGVRSSRHYIVPALGAGLSGYAVGRGWKIENGHYQQAAAMVGVVMADFMNYRQNVISEHGKDADRRYLTTRKNTAVDISKEGGAQVKAVAGDDEGMVVDLVENSLRILYSKETTPGVWNESHVIRMHQLEHIVNELNLDLVYGGGYSINDVRRYFYGRQGDIPEGNLFGRVWDPGDPAHPERGAKVNLHYEDDEDFMLGLKDHCWIIIDIDTEPLYTLQKQKRDREMARSMAYYAR